jgi:D-amino-acid dehydrogenase
MKTAVIGAGIVGLTTAQALHASGHEVTVYERHGSAATQASFANAGWLAPGYVTPWAAPGMLNKVLRQSLTRDAAVRLSGWPTPALLGWLWKWRHACEPATYSANRAAMLALARDSLARTLALARDTGIDHEHGQGALVLLRGEAEVAQSRAGLKVLAELGVPFHLIGPEACRQIEPALEAGTALKAGIHLPDAQSGNCRQFALELKAVMQAAGVQFRFAHAVRRLDSADGVTVHACEVPADADTSLGTFDVTRAPPDHSQRYDAVVVCAALDAPRLLRPLRLPMQPVHGYSVTLPVRQLEAYPDLGPRAALMDERYKVAITRLGERVRVAGSAELGGDPRAQSERALATLYRVLQDWFPSAARQAHTQTWKGARPMLPDGPPAIGASGRPGIWVNTGHGSSGWALACGSAQLVADLIDGRTPTVDAARFSPQRWR